MARLAGTGREIGRSLGRCLKEQKPGFFELFTRSRFDPASKGFSGFDELKAMCERACPGAGTFLGKSGVFLVLIFARACGGVFSAFTLPKGVLTLVLIAVAGCAGKMLGGLAADRWGWLKAATAAVALSAPLLALTNGVVWIGAAGVLLFQAAMLVTLAAAAGIIPRTPGLAFGLNCLMLILGGLIDSFPVKYDFHHPLAVAAAVAVTALLLAGGLALLTGKLKRGAGNRGSTGR